MGKKDLNEKVWKTRYLIALKEDFTIKDIMIIRNTSSSGAIVIRKDAIKLLQEENPKYIEPKTKIPAEAVFKVTGHNLDYYYNKMVAERKAFN